MVRRLLPLIFAACAAVPIPACVTVSSQPPNPPVAPHPVKPPITSEFAKFPTRPGESVPKNPELVVSKPPEPDPKLHEPISTPLADQNVIPAVAIPSPTEPPLLAALRLYLDNKPDDAIKQLASLDRASQDHALALMPLLVRGTQTTIAPDEAAVMLEQLNGITSKLESKAPLKVEKVAFCRKIFGFGRFDPWPEGQPYKPNDLAVLYVELKNVGSEAMAGPAGETWGSRVIVCLEVRDANNNLVEQTDPLDWKRRVTVSRHEHVDHSRSPLHDYSRSYRISVPTQPGVYTVTVEAKDHTGKRVARSRPAEFRVAGP
jgi:hypothetical protein